MSEMLLLAAAAAVGAGAGYLLNAWIDRLVGGRGTAPADACQTSVMPPGDRHGTGRMRLRPVVVATVASAMFALGWWYYGAGMLLLSRLLLGCALIVLFVTDLEHVLLPNAVTLPGTLAGFVLSFFAAPGWADSLAGIVLGGGLLLVLAEIQYRLRGQQRLGMGDVKMLAMIGAFLGWPLTLVALVLALCSGSIITVGLIAWRRHSLPPVLPFGTFLAVGAAAAATVGATLIDWYVALW